MKLIVGLGNPGKEYENTRHNIGFMVINKILNDNSDSTMKKKFDGLYCEYYLNGEKVILLKPQSYINLSGEVVRKYVDYFKINIEDVLIINDDLDMPVGKFKIKQNGSSGGHNGLKNIELHLNTSEYKRIKIGISNNKNIDTKDYVLGKLSKEEKNIIDEVINTVCNVINDYVTMSFNDLMSKYNRK